jgi:aldehyde:ferredoxin oxidoreductase
MTEGICSVTGLDLSIEDIYRIGERACMLERAFNVREGFRRSDDTLPLRLLWESVTEGPTKGEIVDLDPMLDEFYEISGWDIKTGIPTGRKHETLDLAWVAEDLREHGCL